ncbi:hypothetical protein BJY21_002522 [Kineosphaera limosa]|nr:hypothetical protein [Kineosphaera limosa]
MRHALLAATPVAVAPLAVPPLFEVTLEER